MKSLESPSAFVNCRMADPSKQANPAPAVPNQRRPFGSAAMVRTSAMLFPPFWPAQAATPFR